LEEAARTEGSEASLVSDKPWRETATLDMVLEVWRRRKWLAIVTFAAVFLPALTIVLSFRISIIAPPPRSS
jgi:hypothetical protein